MLGLKFADRTFRFANLLELQDGLRLTSAGAGLIPFTSMHHGLIRPEGIAPLLEVLDRALDRESVERGGVVVVLDGRVGVRTLLPFPVDPPTGDDGLREQISWEIGTRFNAREPVGGMHVSWTTATAPDGSEVIDAWGVPSAVLESYEEVIDGVGCHVAAWDCDPWALTRFVRMFALSDAADEPEVTLAVAHVEAESLEITLMKGEGSVGVTSLRADTGGAGSRQWDSDEPDAVAAEIGRAVEELGQRWFPFLPAGSGTPGRICFTGSVENPDSLLAALVRQFQSRVEMIDIQARIGIDDALAMSPLIQSNLGSFALCLGGALATLPS